MVKVDIFYIVWCGSSIACGGGDVSEGDGISVVHVGNGSDGGTSSSNSSVGESINDDG